ncbi:MAG: peptidase, partial [Hyphomicrobiaceae bacterium]|nr:peptidase [Hyphomicrobiaceae bacterium]
MEEVDIAAATDRLMRFLKVPGITGEELLIGKDIVAALKQVGVPSRSIRFDDAHTRIELPTQTGNLLVDLPGRGALKDAERVLFMTHMDT